MNDVIYIQSCVTVNRETFPNFVYPVMGITIMLLFTILFLTAVVGVMLWLLNVHIDMNGRIKKIISVIVVSGMIMYLLKTFYF